MLANLTEGSQLLGTQLHLTYQEKKKLTVKVSEMEKALADRTSKLERQVPLIREVSSFPHRLQILL